MIVVLLSPKMVLTVIGEIHGVWTSWYEPKGYEQAGSPTR